MTTTPAPTMSAANSAGKLDWLAFVSDPGTAVTDTLSTYDAEDSFVADNYRELKEHEVFSAAVPAEFGGGNATHAEPPEMMGQLFHLFDAPNRFGLPPFYTLHVWAWKDNPNGAFVNWHPNVSCASFAGSSR